MSGKERCGEYNETLSAYLDGELTSAERTDLLQHLATCAGCRAALEEYRAIGSRIRGLPPILVPESLTASIYMNTVDAPPRRLQVLTSRMAYPAAAVAAVLMVFVVAVFLLVDGYQRRIDPTIVGSSPTNGVMWSTNDPIRIAFNKEMDKQSVEDALGILPTSERDRLELSWEGNTLIIGENRTLRPGTSYSVTVTSEARDKWGNRLSEPFSVGFTTNQSVALESTPSPHPSATASPEVAVVSQASPTPAIASSPTTESSGPTPTRERTNEQTPTNTPEPVNSGQGSGQPPAQNDPPDQPDDDPPPTATATQPAAPAPTNTPEPEPEPTARPTEVPPTATAEPEPEPTSTPEPEPEPSPTEVRPTATPEPEPEPTPTEPGVAITGAFANVYARNEPVRIGLGEPIAPQLGVSVQELDFQHGKMLQNMDTGEIIIMETSGAWELVPDTSSGDLPEFTVVDEDGLWEPGGVFGYIWHNDSYVENILGLAVSGDTHEYQSLVQDFETGRMIYSADGFIYVLYDNGRWELYPDAGPLNDDNTD